MSSTLADSTLWLLVCTAMVFLMQAGFCCLESGLSRSKNSISAAIKNVVDFCVAGGVFWLFGYALMFGSSRGGFVGGSGFFFEDTSPSNSLTVFFLFHLVFCAIAVTIASGAVAERMRFRAYVLLAVIVGGLIYPLFGHWAWAGLENGEQNGWLAGLGFVDFAGSTVVHGVGAWAALAAVLLIGPRVGKFGPTGKPRKFHGHSLPMAALGLFILWFGWLGFNGGRTLVLNGQVPLILINTLLAGLFGGLGTLVWQWFFRQHVSVERIMNGVIAGLVASCASCHAIDSPSAVLIGIGAGLVAEVATQILEHWFRIDDVVGAIAAHGFAGAWGTIAFALYATESALTPGYSRLGQAGVQLLGVGVCFVWSFGVCWLMLKAASHRLQLRVTADEEQAGLNLVEHGAMTDLHDLLLTMEQNMSGNLSRRAAVDECTEAGLIAQQYNKVLSAREQAERQLRRHADLLCESHDHIERQTVNLRQQAKQLETARQEADRANETKSQFLANMSHEIRTPMTAILGYVGLLQDEAMAAGLSDSWHQQLSTIQRNGRHLLEIINDILDVSKIEAGRLEVEQIRFSPRQLVDDVAALMRPRAEEKNLTLEVRCVTPIPESIENDPTRLKQILLNLLGNAVKFTLEGGVRIELSLLGPQDLDDRQPESMLQIDVIDTGIGLTGDQVARLFQPFVQADTSTTRQFGGTGLGLTICKRLTELLGGEITIQRKFGVGSTFRVRIPTGSLDGGPPWKEKPVERETTEPPNSTSDIGPLHCRVLLAEDSPDNQRLFSFLLERAGAEVEVAENGQEAVRLALAAARSTPGRDGARPFDLILMDMQMPVLDGYQATQQLRRCGFAQPIVALTANSLKEDCVRCLAVGCNEFATKPIDRDALIAIVGRWSNGAVTAAPTPNSSRL